MLDIINRPYCSETRLDLLPSRSYAAIDHIIMIIQDTLMIMAMAMVVMKLAVKGFQIAENSSQSFSSSIDCACPGDQLLIDCSVTGGVATVWRGTAFNCHGISNSIILRHSRFYNLSEPAAGECNHDSYRIMAHSLGVSDTFEFTSQLSVIVTGELNNKTIECIRDTNGSTDAYELVGTTTIAVATRDYDSFIYHDDMRLLEVNRSHLIFQLPNVTMTLLCPIFSEYVINSSNCGKCSKKANINDTIALCDISDSMRYHYDHDDDHNDIVCIFEARIQVQCQNTDLSVNTSTEMITVNLRVPNPPKFNSSAHYHHDLGSWSIQTLFVYNMEDIFNISDGIDGSPISFTIIYSDQTLSTNMITCGQDTIPAAMFCEWDVPCIHEFNISSSSCSSSTDITVSMFATNLLGNGPVAIVQVEVTTGDTNVEGGAGDSNQSLSGKASAIIIASVVIILCIILMIAVLAIVLTIMRRFKNKTRTSKQTHTNIYTVIRASSDRLQGKASTVYTASFDNANLTVIDKQSTSGPGENASDKDVPLQGCIYADVCLKTKSESVRYLGSGAQDITAFDDKVEYAKIEHMHPISTAVIDNDTCQQLLSHSKQLDGNIDLDMLLIQLQTQVTPKWYQFGLAVGISKEVMDKYSDHPDEECLVEVLDCWLRNHGSKPTWKEVADALREIDLHQLADDIMKSYDTGELPIQVDMNDMPGEQHATP